MPHLVNNLDITFSAEFGKYLCHQHHDTVSRKQCHLIPHYPLHFIIDEVSLYPANTKHLDNICTVLVQRRRRWADVVQCLYNVCVCWVCTQKYPNIIILK